MDKNLKQGVEIEKEHRNLYIELSNRLLKQGIKMPMTETEFFTWIAKAHIAENKDYYPQLLKYVEKDSTPDIIVLDSENAPHKLQKGNTVGVKSRGNYTGVVTSIIDGYVYIKGFSDKFEPSDLIWLTETPSTPTNKLHGISQIQLKTGGSPTNHSTLNSKL